MHDKEKRAAVKDPVTEAKEVLARLKAEHAKLPDGWFLRPVFSRKIAELEALIDEEQKSEPTPSTSP